MRPLASAEARGPARRCLAGEAAGGLRGEEEGHPRIEQQKDCLSVSESIYFGMGSISHLISAYETKFLHSPQHILCPTRKLSEDGGDHLGIVVYIQALKEFIYGKVFALADSIRMRKYFFNKRELIRIVWRFIVY